MLWEIFWGALHICRSKISDVENSFCIRHVFESPQPQGCSWRGYATQEADQELKWKIRTLSIWKIWVLEFLVPKTWDTRGGLARPPPPGCYNTSKSPGLIGLKVSLLKKNFLVSSFGPKTKKKNLDYGLVLGFFSIDWCEVNWCGSTYKLVKLKLKNRLKMHFLCF